VTREHHRHMPHLFSPEGEAALAAAMQHGPLIALDFDGTLAPIVATPDMARVPLPVSSRLRKLRDVLHVAILTGRSVEGGWTSSRTSSSATTAPRMDSKNVNGRCKPGWTRCVRCLAGTRMRWHRPA
jgi:hypothetical protein